jgi:hypothetical protein
VAKKILWNAAAPERGAEELEPEELTCPECETTPRLRQFTRMSCECGKLEGVVTAYES